MTDLINKTSNQHYISQVEFRWNSINPKAENDLMKVYRFKLINEGFLKLRCPEKKRIKYLSCGDDLFSLAVFDDDTRLNMEKYFGYFEAEYNDRVSKFLSDIATKIQNSGEGLYKVDGSEFISDIKFFQKIKFLNFIRNPHNIRRALKLFDFARDYIVHGTGGDFQLILNALIKNKKTHRDYVCRTYGVTSSEFDSWIKLILLFVYFDDNMMNPTLDGMMDEFFKAKELHTAVIIAYYPEETRKSPLIPDVGSVVNDDMTYAFNISRSCFIVLEHTLLESEYSRNNAKKVADLMGVPFTDDFFEVYKKHLQGEKLISIYIDDDELLSGYNSKCIEVSKEFVYSSSAVVHGADVIRA
ncbi:TPA: hypothetical protein ACGQVR_005664 [Klebsiella michiganensis]|nr:MULTISPECIES: hypothetical protein [Enterobacteriaceae]MDU7288227.1 hypothetical protein [Corynebacterium kroppenstedtii]HAO1326156.1 hypothetical protein [Escherichia coli]EIX9563033.1 hypothetical protein [Klebsiella pneumoniae]ELA3045924.1 hypothetical protein [Klebsiella pneumoniae]EPO14704.1 hypothetical protein H217_5346 [Klebsiella pneumoniae DMC0799]